MALATVADVEAALGRDLDADEDVDSLLEEASDLVFGYLGWGEIPDEVPGAVVRVVASIVAAALTAPSVPAYPAGVQATAGPFSIQVGSEGGSSKVFLTGALKLRLRPYRTSVVSVPLRSER